MRLCIYPSGVGHACITTSSSDEGRDTIEIIINWRIRTINYGVTELSSQWVVSKERATNGWDH